MGTLMKMVAVVLLLPFVLAQVLPGNGGPCVYKAVGDSVTFSLLRMDCVEDSLSWKLNSSEIFRKKKQSVSVGKSSDVTEDGSLKLVNLQVPRSGVYTAELYDTDGKLCGQARKNLCVIEPVSRPYVTYTCSKDAVTLTCNGAESKVNWTLNGNTSEGELKKTLTVPGKPAHGAKYSCTAWNEVSQEKSEDTTVWCEVQLSLKVMSQNEEVREGEDVSILCASIPPADEYTVWTPRKETLKLGADGKFTLQQVTKNDGGTYLCQPRWTSRGLYAAAAAANATVQLRVSSGQALRGGATPRVTSGSEFTLLLATHLLLVLCLSGPVV